MLQKLVNTLMAQRGVGIASAQPRQVLAQLDRHVDREAGGECSAGVVRNAGAVAVRLAAGTGPAATVGRAERQQLGDDLLGRPGTAPLG